MAVLFLPVLLIILLAIYTQRRMRRKQQDLLLLYLNEKHPSQKDEKPRIYWLPNQLLAVFEAIPKLVIIKKEGPHVDAVSIQLGEIKSIDFFNDTESMKQEGKESRTDLVVMQMGLLIGYKEQAEKLLFFDYATEPSSQLPDKEKQAISIRNYILDLIKSNQKNNR